MNQEKMVSVPLRLLQRMQWQGAYAANKCPVCGDTTNIGHRSDCELALILKDVTDVIIQKES